MSGVCSILACLPLLLVVATPALAEIQNGDFEAGADGWFVIAVPPWMVTFPPTGAKWQVSQNGGSEPRWSRDGRELFYFDSQNRLISAWAAFPKPSNHITRAAQASRTAVSASITRGSLSGELRTRIGLVSAFASLAVFQSARCMS